MVATGGILGSFLTPWQTLELRPFPISGCIEVRQSGLQAALGHYGIHSLDGWAVLAAGLDFGLGGARPALWILPIAAAFVLVSEVRRPRRGWIAPLASLAAIGVLSLCLAHGLPFDEARRQAVAGRMEALARATDPHERAIAEDGLRSIESEVRVRLHPAPWLALAASILSFLAAATSSCRRWTVERHAASERGGRRGD